MKWEWMKERGNGNGKEKYGVGLEKFGIDEV